MRLPLVLSLPFVLFGFELDFSKEFSKSVVPNELSAKVKVIVEDKEEKQVISNLNKYNKFLKNYDDVDKSNVSISITPKYSYKDGKSKLEGYVGNLNYTISSKKSDDVKEFLEEFYKQEKNKETSFLVPNMSWKIDDKLYNKNLEEIKLNAIVWTEEYAENVSDDIDRDCSIKKISLRGNNARPYHANMKMMNSEAMSNDTAVNMPITEKIAQDIVLNADIILECK